MGLSAVRPETESCPVPMLRPVGAAQCHKPDSGMSILGSGGQIHNSVADLSALRPRNYSGPQGLLRLCFAGFSRRTIFVIPRWQAEF